MGQRNMVYTGPMMDTEIEHARLQPEPAVIPYGRIITFPQPNNCILPPGNSHGPPPPGVAQYNNLDSNMFIAAPPGVRVVPVPVSPFPGNQFIDGFNVVFKRKIPVNFQYFYPAPGSGSFVVPEYRGVRNRAAGATGLDPVLQFVPLSHGGQAQPVQVVPLPTPWLDQPFCANAPGIPYMQGYINGNPVAFVHPAPIAPPPPLPPMPPMRGGHNTDFHPQLAPPLPGPRFVGPTPPFGIGVYQPHRQELTVEPTSRNRGFPHFRVLPDDGVATLNLSNYGRSVDHHRDMRLDIDHMSYEELLALGEQIGSVGSDLSDEFILENLKTKTFVSPKSSSHLEDASSADQELNLCTICQTNYNDQEKIGVLDCSHEYHVSCIKKWLVVKNTCPVCKSTGLATQGKESGTDSEKASSGEP